MDDTFLIRFTPERWNWSEKFGNFVGVSRAFDREAQRGTSTFIDHLAKFDLLAGLANRIGPDLKKDQDELTRAGYTDSRFHREFAALVEVLVTELYACLDGLRRLLYSVFKNVNGVQNQSTEKLFRRAVEGAYGDGIPLVIVEALTAASESWFPGLRTLRRELTHGQTGSCHLERNSDRIGYLHGGLGDKRRAFVIDDIVAQVNRWREGVVELAEVVFAEMYSKLEQVPLPQVCGFYRGRLYERRVVPSAALSFNDGVCMSKQWFMSTDGLRCPLQRGCGAFARTVEE